MSTTPQAGKLVFIALGQEFRSDDGLGLVVGRTLEATLHRSTDHDAFQVFCCSGDVSEILEIWAGQDAVVIDAIDDAQSKAGQLIIREVVDRGMLLPAFLEWQRVACTSTHGLDLSEALQLSAALGRMPTHLRIAGAVGHSFGHGLGLSEPVKRAVPALINVCAAWAHDWQGSNAGAAEAMSCLQKETTHA